MAHNKPLIDRYNNFDFLRVVFAIAVIITHSFPLFGRQNLDWLGVQTKATVNFSDLGLSGFFCISGYLVYLSSQRSSSYRSFISKRILRIFPGLAVVLLLSAFVLGPINSSIPGYFSNPTVYTYFFSNLLLFDIHFCIDGVFNTNPYGCAINGSLWTIPYEFLFYLLFFVFFLKRSLNRLVSLACIPLFFVVVFLYWRYPTVGYMIPGTAIIASWVLYFASWFLAGIILGLTEKHWKPYKVYLAAGTFVAMLYLLSGPFPKILMHFIWPVFVVSFGACKAPVISKWDKIGDPSYGIYIYAFVVQQTLLSYFKDVLSFQWFMALSIIISVVLGFLSWHLIEKKALKFKRRRSGKEIPEFQMPVQATVPEQLT